MRSTWYRRWDPPQSNLQIEFPAELLRGFSPPAATAETRGMLYGIRHAAEIRILTAGPNPGGGLQAVGIYVARLRGEVFLTEANLEWFEKTRAAVALVTAGGKGGFFVRETNGSIQSVRSYEEFSLTDGPSPPAPLPAAVSKPVAPGKQRLWPAAAAVIAVALPAVALAYLRPATASTSVPLQVVEQSGQLHISWKPGQRGILELIDGAEHVSVPVTPEQSNATYLRRGTEVEINLIPIKGARESAHYLGPASAGSPAETLRAKIGSLKAEANTLRAGAAANRKRIHGMETKIARITRQ